MKRLLFTTIVFCYFLSQVIAQSEIEIGLTTEGSWFMPGKYDLYSPQNKPLWTESTIVFVQTESLMLFDDEI